MGNIKRFNLKEHISKYDIKIFVETGTGAGNGINFAGQHNFEKLYSIEIQTELYNLVSSHIINNKIRLLNTDSLSGITDIFSNTENLQNTMFWLDAHYPGADYGYAKYTDNINNEPLRLPLEHELRKICEVKDVSNDVFIIDDLRIYLDGPYVNGNISDEYKPKNRNIDFIYELFDKTHNINLSYDDEGYIIITPKT